MQDLTLFGEEIKPYIDEIAALRLQYFVEYPYLYQGELANERDYLALYTQHPDGSCIAKTVENKLVGFCTGMPINLDSEFNQKLAQHLDHAGHDPALIYYIGEAITLEAYRNQGIAGGFAQQIEQFAARKHYKSCCFLAIDTNPSDKLWPANYREISSLFKKMGYHKIDDLLELDWPTRQETGEVKTETHNVALWLKQLA